MEISGCRNDIGRGSNLLKVVYVQRVARPPAAETSGWHHISVRASGVLKTPCVGGKGHALISGVRPATCQPRASRTSRLLLYMQAAQPRRGVWCLSRLCRRQWPFRLCLTLERSVCCDTWRRMLRPGGRPAFATNKFTRLFTPTNCKCSKRRTEAQHSGLPLGTFNLSRGGCVMRHRLHRVLAVVRVFTQHAFVYSMDRHRCSFDEHLMVT